MQNEKKSFITESDKSLNRFLIKYFFKSKVGPIIALIFPILFMAMYAVISTHKEIPGGKWAYFVEGFPAFLILSVIPLSFITLPQSIVELKNSILLRKIKTSGFTKLRYLVFIYLEYFVFDLISVIITLIISLIVINKEVSTHLGNVDWGGLVFGILLLILTANAFGIMIGSLFKSAMVAQLVGIAMLIFTMAFGGLFMPINLIGDIMPMKAFSLLLPCNYPTNLIMNATFSHTEAAINAANQALSKGEAIFGKDSLVVSQFNNDNLGYSMFDLKHGFYYLTSSQNVDRTLPGFVENKTKIQIDCTSIFPVWQKAMNIVMPFVLTPAMLAIGWYKFSWYGR